MFSKFTMFLVVSLGAFSASAWPVIGSSCNSGSLQCCEALQSPTEYSASSIAALVGVAVSSVTGQLGLQCNAITGVGVGTGANCASTPVCCEQTFTNQLIGINCNPANVGA